jgi:hypothetical protein
MAKTENVEREDPREQKTAAPYVEETGCAEAL